MKTAPFVPLLLLCSVALADVASVRREVGRINALKLSTQTRDRTDLSTEGAQILVGRDAKGAVRKIVAHIFGETGRQDETIYLQNGKPLFVFSVEQRYDQPIGVSSRVKVVSRVETRLYFSNGKLISKRVGSKATKVTRTQKAQIESQTFALLRDYLSSDEANGSTG